MRCKSGYLELCLKSAFATEGFGQSQARWSVVGVVQLAAMIAAIHGAAIPCSSTM